MFIDILTWWIVLSKWKKIQYESLWNTFLSISEVWFETIGTIWFCSVGNIMDISHRANKNIHFPWKLSPLYYYITLYYGWFNLIFLTQYKRQLLYTLSLLPQLQKPSETPSDESQLSWWPPSLGPFLQFLRLACCWQIYVHLPNSFHFFNYAPGDMITRIFLSIFLCVNLKSTCCTCELLKRGKYLCNHLFSVLYFITLLRSVFTFTQMVNVHFT